MLARRVVAAASRNRKRSGEGGANRTGLVSWLQTFSTSIRPTSIGLLKASPPSPSFKGLELDYDSGKKFCFSAEFLRVFSPSADSMRMSASGKRNVISGRQHVHILGVEPVGNYGIRIVYDDMNDTGIYTWNYLHDLGNRKFHFMREYVKSLRQQGLSRDPVRRK